MVRTPLGFCKRIFTHAQLTAFLVSIMFTIIEFDIAQIMFVTASRMQQFTEQAFADHVQRSHAVATIANVFHDVQMASRSFRYVDQIPAFFQRIGGRDFHTDIRDTGFHGCNRHRHVPFPRAGDDDTIEFFVVQHLFKFTFAACIYLRSRNIELGDMIQRTLDRTSLDIADSHDLVSGDRQHVVNMFVTTRTCTDKTEA